MIYKYTRFTPDKYDRNASIDINGFVPVAYDELVANNDNSKFQL